jgi:UDP-N-acetyl-D-galactosamine dehydrogenase
MQRFQKDLSPVAVIGLGYVGLPILLAASEHFACVGFDIDDSRVQELKIGIDRNNDINAIDFQKINPVFTSKPKDLTGCKTFVIALPTPLGQNFQPDISILKSGIELISPFITTESLIIFESTVYPGCTEDVCIPLIENLSNLKSCEEFSVAFSPERINPGDKVHSFKNIDKVVSGLDNKSVEKAVLFYETIIQANIFKAASIRVAEMSKVLENTQRDVNIALMNEISIICSKLGVSVHDVLEAANTKWNFLNFTPGLVGGHCIGIDPYYLAFSATAAQHNPDIILTSRRINENYIDFLLSLLTSNLIKGKIQPTNILVLGGTFKENCSDIRNSKALEFCIKLSSLYGEINLLDPYISVLPEFYKDISLNPKNLKDQKFDVIISLVKHDEFFQSGFSYYKGLLSSRGLIFDFRNFFPSFTSEKLIKL